MIGLLIAISAARAAAPGLDEERWQLPNGLDVVLVRDDSAPVVTVDVWYHVGSRDEVQGRTGFAHLFEHVMFQGSPSQPGEYFQPLERVGARANGSTTQDRTNYYQTLPAEQLPLALFLESDRMGWLLDVLDQQKLDTQREVVRNERRQRIEDVPYGDAWLLLDQNLFPPGHGYRHPVIGSHADLEAATLDDVRAFFRKWYAPDNAVLVVSGSFDPAVAKRLITEYFGDIPASGAERPPPPRAPGLRADVQVREYRDVPQQRVWMAWHSPPAMTADDAHLDLLAEVLAGGRDGRLVQELVERRRIAQDVRAFQASSQWSSKFVVLATAAPGHTTDEVVAGIRGVIEGTLRGAAAPTETELDAIRADYELAYWSELETTLGKAEAVQRCVNLTGTADCIAADLGRYAEASPEDVVLAGRRTLEAPSVTLHIVPEADRPPPPAPVAEPERRRKR